MTVNNCSGIDFSMDKNKVLRIMRETSFLSKNDTLIDLKTLKEISAENIVFSFNVMDNQDHPFVLVFKNDAGKIDLGYYIEQTPDVLEIKFFFSPDSLKGDLTSLMTSYNKIFFYSILRMAETNKTRSKTAIDKTNYIFNKWVELRQKYPNTLYVKKLN